MYSKSLFIDDKNQEMLDKQRGIPYNNIMLTL